MHAKIAAFKNANPKAYDTLMKMVASGDNTALTKFSAHIQVLPQDILAEVVAANESFIKEGFPKLMKELRQKASVASGGLEAGSTVKSKGFSFRVAEVGKELENHLKAPQLLKTAIMELCAALEINPAEIASFNELAADRRSARGFMARLPSHNALTTEEASHLLDLAKRLPGEVRRQFVMTLLTRVEAAGANFVEEGAMDVLPKFAELDLAEKSNASDAPHWMESVYLNGRELRKGNTDQGIEAILDGMSDLPNEHRGDARLYLQDMRQLGTADAANVAKTAAIDAKAAADEATYSASTASSLALFSMLFRK